MTAATTVQVAHLFRRAGYATTVDQLVGALGGPDEGAATVPTPQFGVDPATLDVAQLKADPAARETYQLALRRDRIALSDWWIGRMLSTTDTHADQAPTQSTLLSQLGTAVPAFLDAIRTDPRGRGTVVLVYTEFGRRVWSNASAGTDHGWANVVFAAGQPVRRGFYGETPGLSRLSDGNQIYTTDFRSVYATAFESILGVDPRSFLGGTFPVQPFVLT